MHSDDQADTARLHYFKDRGRAETTRWILAIGWIGFENVSVDTAEALAALRATGKLPFDQMPLLEIHGLNLSQSSAMIRYLARRGGYYGETDADATWSPESSQTLPRPRCKRRSSRRRRSAWTGIRTGGSP